LQQSICQRAFAVVDVGDDAEVSNVPHGSFKLRESRIDDLSPHPEIFPQRYFENHASLTLLSLPAV
jgi:hypothetical protein